MKSPILLLTYNRPCEFARTMESLASCDHCEEYDLYINIDAPNIFNSDDISKQIEIKNTIEKYRERFNGVHIREHKYHKGLANSVIESVTKIINRFGRIIVLEDDFLVSHDCLSFLEDSLDYYENSPRIWSVTAFSAPLKNLEHYKKDVYLTYRACSRVWGTWDNRWNEVEWDVYAYSCMWFDQIANPKYTKGGYDLPCAMNKQMQGLTDSWSIRWGFAAMEKDMMTVYPAHNRVKHIGINGTHVNGDFPQMEMKEQFGDYCFGVHYNKLIDREWRNYSGFTYNQWRKYVSFVGRNGIDKYESMFYVMQLWKKISLSGHCVSEYFSNRNYQIIAIYGKGRIGELLESELRDTSINVSYYIDRNVTEGSVECYTPDQDLPKCDCVVITVTYNAESIRHLLTEKGIMTVKTIVEVLRDA